MRYIFLFPMIFLMKISSAQCPFTPTISGDTMLCPLDTVPLTTQTFDSYQWYKRGFSDSVAQAIPGADSQTLMINQYDDAAFYFSVEVTENGCTERSEKIFVDGYAFLPPVVGTAGDFTTGINGEFIICTGDTAFFTLLQPYDTLI